HDLGLTEATGAVFEFDADDARTVHDRGYHIQIRPPALDAGSGEGGGLLGRELGGADGSGEPHGWGQEEGVEGVCAGFLDVALGDDRVGEAEGGGGHGRLWTIDSSASRNSGGV